MMKIFARIVAPLAVFLATTCGAAGATVICWIERVQTTENGLRVFHSSGYVTSIRRKATGLVDRNDADAEKKGFFDLQDGDEAALHSGAHDWCSVKAERYGDRFGVQIEANSQPHGFPLSRASSFVVAEGYLPSAHVGVVSNDVSSLAGVYSSAHPIEVNGVKLQTNGYIEISRTGQITAFEQNGEGSASVGSGCYVLASGTATNAGLQGRMLTLGVSPVGDATFQVRAGDHDTFGILVEPAINGDMRWFFHWGEPNSTATVIGSRNVVNSSSQASYSISGPAVATPTPDQLRTMLCRAGM